MPKQITEDQTPLTAVQRALLRIGQFDDNKTPDNLILESAFYLTVASSDPKYADELQHIDNGLERLGGIAIQRSEEFKQSFAHVIQQGEEYVQKNAAQKYTVPITAHASKVAHAMHYTCAA